MARAAVTAICALYVLVYIVPLGVRPLIIPDESRYAEVPREMLASADWIVPRLNGVRYFEKPVLGYWLGAASIRFLGQNRFAVRLPTALSAGLTACLLFALIRRHGGGDRPALFSAAILLTSLLFFGVGTFAVLDMPLTALLTGAMVCFFLASREQGWRRRGFEAVFGLFCGPAFLTKGFLAFAVPVVTIVPFMLWERRGRELFTMVWVPLLTAAAVCLPWSLAIHAREPDFWNFFFWNEHIRRFLSSQPQHREAFWYFLPVLIGGLLPWTLVAPAAVAGLRRRGVRNDGVLRYCLCWFIFPFLFFSMSRGKLATYILPCFPPLAFLMATGLRAYLDGRRRKLFDRGAYLGAAIFAAVASILVIHGVAGVDFLPIYNDGGKLKWMLSSLGLFVWAGALLAAGWQRITWHKLLAFGCGPVVLMAVAGLAFPDEAKDSKAPEEFLLRHIGAVTPETTVVSGKSLVRAVCWSYRRDDLLVLGGAGELAYGMAQPDSEHRHLDLPAFTERVRMLGPRQRLVLIAEAERYAEWEDRLPIPFRRDLDQGFAFVEYQSASPHGGGGPPSRTNAANPRQQGREP